MTPTELDKSLTLMLNELLADTGFSKKKKGRLKRKKNECEQFFSFYFTRERGLPGNMYSLTATMSFSFPEVDKLTSCFMGEEYEAKWDTGARPLYTVIPDSPVLKYRYCADEALEQFAEMLSQDFHSYALSFYDKYDTLNKLERYFDQHPDYINLANGFSVVRTNKYGNGRWCCKAAVLCILEKWDKLKVFRDETELLLDDQKERIVDYISNI